MENLVARLKDSKFAKDWKLEGVYDMSENPDKEPYYCVVFESGDEIIGTARQTQAESELRKALAELGYNVAGISWIDTNPNEINFTV